MVGSFCAETIKLFQFDMAFDLRSFVSPDADESADLNLLKFEGRTDEEGRVDPPMVFLWLGESIWLGIERIESPE